MAPSPEEFSRHELPLALGQLYGLRFWHTRRGAKPDVTLYGCWLRDWHQGVNSARCFSAAETAKRQGEKTEVSHQEHQSPDLGCGCGFWAYWDNAAGSYTEYNGRQVDVTGVIRGFGKTIIGSKGFRCEKAEILGLCVNSIFCDKVPGRLKEHVSALSVRYSVPVFFSVPELLETFPLTTEYRDLA